MEQVEKIAVVGMSLRVPGATSPDEFWGNLARGVCSVRHFSADELVAAGVAPEVAGDPDYVRARGVVGDVDRFDATAFGISPLQAAVMDPQHRLFLQGAWEALDDAGCDPARELGAIGVYASQVPNTYQAAVLVSSPDMMRSAGELAVGIGNGIGHLATNVSYYLGLRGPAIAVQTACSSSLVAVHLACQALIAGECDAALAGGVALEFPTVRGYFHHDGGTRSPDGFCRAFSASAAGMVPGEGYGIVVLRRLDDALREGYRVRAVISGWAVNNDGAHKTGYTAPSAAGQAAVIREALQVAGVDPATISYVEAHGTATAIGDAIEVAGLKQVFGTGAARRSCALGSVKSNVGHLDAASGVVGLIKVVLMLEHRSIPPTLHCPDPNPELGLDDSPFHIPQHLAEWKVSPGPRRAGISSFGIGGTNAHIVVEEAPAQQGRGAAGEPRDYLLVLSAASPEALERLTDRVGRHLGSLSPSDAADVAYTLATGRRVLRHRRALLGGDPSEAGVQLLRREQDRVAHGEEAESERPVVFLFAGQGTHRAGMGRALYRRFRAFQEALDRCAEFLLPLPGGDIRPSVLGAPGAAAAADARTAPLVHFAFSFACARLWASWGVRPRALLGHSVGEYVAACLSGVIELEDALRLLVERERLTADLPPGRMLAVNAPEALLLRHLGSDLDVAGRNAPDWHTVSGPEKAVRALALKLRAERIAHRALKVSRAYHSRMMDAVREPFTEACARVRTHAPTVPYLSNVTGDWVSHAQVADPAYWFEQLRAPTRLSDALATVVADDRSVLLEVGAGTSLSGLAARNARQGWRGHTLAALPSGTDEVAEVSRAVAQLWVVGGEIDWNKHFQGAAPRRTSLPAYPFAAERHWAAPVPAEREPRELLWTMSPPRGETISVAGPEGDGREGPGDQTLHVVRHLAAEVLGVPVPGPLDGFFKLGGSSLTAVQLVTRLRQVFGVRVPLGEFFQDPTPAGLARAVASRSTGEEHEVRASLFSEAVALRPCPAPEPPPAPPGASVSGLAISVFFFGSDARQCDGDRYRLVMDVAKFADRNGFTAVWTPERHFGSFGGLFPNPAVLGAALAAATERIGIRAGSVVLPLHHPARVVEEWAVVDNVSRGRVGISLAPGFHPTDFALVPEAYADRRERMWNGVEALRTLWRGEALPFTDGTGEAVELRVYPSPVQPELPVWVTAVDRVETFERAGEARANVLTSLLSLDLAQLRACIRRYRERLQTHHPGTRGTVSVMLHTCVAADASERAREPLRRYLSAHLEFTRAFARASGVALEELAEDDVEALVDHAADRLFESSGLLGTPEHCAALLAELASAGVDEVACLVDFGVPYDAVMDSMNELAELIRQLAPPPSQRSTAHVHARPTPAF